jgi:small subunit ribosomal protein S8
MFTDPISDMLTRIRNAGATRKIEVSIPFSKLKFEIAKLLKHENFVENVESVSEGTLKSIKVTLKYEGKQSVIHSLRRVSKPGQRVYASKEELPIVLNNLGIAILSTSRGLMTNKQAKRDNIGGEVLCEVW